MLRVTVFDDNLQRRQSLELLLNTSDGFVCSGLYEDGTQAAQRVAESAPDVVLMDIDMPLVNGIEAVKEIRSQFPNLPVLMQTVFDEDEKIFTSILAGANGYLLKNIRSAALLLAIQEGFEGNSPMTPSVARKVLDHFRSEKTLIKNPYNLTPRETDILQQLVLGKSYKMIAAALGITLYTVNDHIKGVYRKLHVHNMSEAVAKALKEKLI